ncbi:MAG: RDD family protein [Acidimicrobiia bacterium]|nr:RDD family protein [Acidimicrobiia bacterium]
MQIAQNIVTPEAVVLDFQAAGVSSRILARGVDLAVQLAMLWLLQLVIGLGAAFSTVGASVAAVIIAFLVLLGYPALSEWLWQGRTVGKLALGLRVVSLGGGPVGFTAAATRSLFQIIDIYATGGGIAIITALGNRRSQRLGDLAAGTFVIRERRVQGHTRPVVFRPPYGYEGYAQALDVTSLTTQQYGLVRSYLLRLNELGVNARWSIGRRLSDNLARQIHHLRPPSVHHETFLVCVAAAYQMRHARLPGPGSRT